MTNTRTRRRPDAIRGSTEIPQRRHNGGAGQRVYDLLRADIMDGALGPGAPLREVELGARYGVSRTPVREALQRLEGERWVRRDPRVGITVAAPDAEEVIESYAVQEALEGMAARLAAQRLTDEWAITLRALQDALVAELASGAVQRAVQLSSELHRSIWTISGNRTLGRLLDEIEQTLGGRMRRSGLAHPGREETAQLEHEQVLEAIVARDPDRAEAAMRAHLRAARDVRIKLSIQERGASVG